MIIECILSKRTTDPSIPFAFIEDYVKQVICKLIGTIAKIASSAIAIKDGHILDKISTSLLELTEICIYESSQSSSQYLDSIIFHILELVSRMFKSFFKVNNDLTFYFLSTIIRDTTTMGLYAIKYGKDKIAERIVNLLLELSFHISPFDEYGYDTARIASRILRIVIYAVDKENVAITKYATQKLKEYSVNIASMSKNPQPLEDIKTLKGDLDEFAAKIFNLDSSLKFLKENLSNNAWNKYEQVITI